jgi:hypothetical protein
MAAFHAEPDGIDMPLKIAEALAISLPVPFALLNVGSVQEFQSFDGFINRHGCSLPVGPSILSFSNKDSVEIERALLSAIREGTRCFVYFDRFHSSMTSPPMRTTLRSFTRSEGPTAPRAEARVFVRASTNLHRIMYHQRD